MTSGIHADDGSLWSWGGDATGAHGAFLGGRPVRIGGSYAWTAVTASWYHACAVRADRTLWCWGGNIMEQLGDGTTIRASSPSRSGTAAGAGRSPEIRLTCGTQAPTGRVVLGWGSDRRRPGCRYPDPDRARHDLARDRGGERRLRDPDRRQPVALGAGRREPRTWQAEPASACRGPGRRSPRTTHTARPGPTAACGAGAERTRSGRRRHVHLPHRAAPVAGRGARPPEYRLTPARSRPTARLWCWGLLGGVRTVPTRVWL